jgi:hypothetical protein
MGFLSVLLYVLNIEFLMINRLSGYGYRPVMGYFTLAPNLTEPFRFTASPFRFTVLGEETDTGPSLIWT